MSLKSSNRVKIVLDFFLFMGIDKINIWCKFQVSTVSYSFLNYDNKKIVTWQIEIISNDVKIELQTLIKM